LRRTGLLEFGPSDDAEFSVARQALAVHGIEHEHAVDPAPFRIPSEWQTCSTPRSGYLRVAACLGAFRHEAEAAGARIVNDSRVREVVRCGERPGIVHESGETEWADAVVVATGAYAPTLLPGFVARHPIEARRRVLVWLDPPADAAPLLAAMPCWAAFAPEGFFYGFPFADEGVRGLKLACHHRQGNVDGPVTAETVDREIHDRDLAPVLEFVREHLPIAGTKVVHATVCMYAMTRSGDFLIDVDEDDPRVLVVGGFSGHGFKFAPVIGEMAADLLERGESARRLDCFTRDHHLC
jgi:glycine/D-amino acid oxidase-like deaminating enzyme